MRVLDQSLTSVNRLRQLVRYVEADEMQSAELLMGALMESNNDAALLLATLAQWVVAPYPPGTAQLLVPSPDPAVPEVVRVAQQRTAEIVDDLLGSLVSSVNERLVVVVEEGPMSVAYLAAQLLMVLAEQARRGLQSFEELPS